MKSILLLGRGYVGTRLNNFLTANGVEVDAFKRAELDYTSPIVLQKFLQERPDKYEAVINCSGYTGVPNVDACEKNKQDCWFWNVIVPRNVVLSSNMFSIPTIQVSSGCIYTGQDKEYSETDEPNFGLFNDSSSFYSKSKHACETIFQNCYGYILRVRMPFEGTTSSKNYINKIYKYKNLINYKNSLTSITDLNNFIYRFLFLYREIPAGPINVVNEGALNAKEIVEIMRKYNLENPDWKFVDMSELQIVAQRSNCVLSTEKIKSYNLGLPTAVSSLERDIEELSRNVFLQK